MGKMETEKVKKGLWYIPEVLLLAGGLFCLLSELINASLISLTTIAGLIMPIKYFKKRITVYGETL